MRNVDAREANVRDPLSTESNYSSVFLTAIMAVFGANLIMAEAGGALKPYEMQAAHAAVSSFLTGAPSAEAPIVFPVRERAVHLIPALLLRGELSTTPLELLGAPGALDVPRLVSVTQVVELPLESCACEPLPLMEPEPITGDLSAPAPPLVLLIG